MSSYQKFTLAFFRKRLQEGAYENATGANRAIGKTRELTDTEKDSARALVRKHFGESAPAPKKAAKKTVKKAAAKKTVSKPAAKAAKKAVKKASKKEAKASKPAKKLVKRVKQAASGKAPAAAARGKGKRKGSKRTVQSSKVEEPAPARKAVETGASREQKDVHLIELMGTVVNTLSTVVKSMESSKDLFPKADLEAGVKSAHASMTRAVRIIDGALTPLDKSAEGKSGTVTGKRGKGVADKQAPADEEEVDTGVSEEDGAGVADDA